MAAKRHWMVTAGLISGFIIIGFIVAGAILVIVTRGFHWRDLMGQL